MTLLKTAPLSEPKQTIKVATYGMDARSIKMLSLTIEKNYAGLVTLVKSENEADAVLIDLDCGDTILNERKKGQNKQLPTIVISIKPRNIENTVYLRKPIGVPLLLKTIRELANGASPEDVNSSLKPIKAVQIDTTINAKKPDAYTKTTANALNERVSDATSTAPKIKRSGNVNFAGLYFDPDDYALGALTKAIALARKHSCPVKMTCWDKRFIVFNPARNEEILTNVSDGLIRNLGVMRVAGEELCIETEILDSGKFSELLKSNSDSLRLFSAQSFIWKLTISTARGRIPKGTDLAKPVYLHHWPNMTRLESVPHGLHIIALWAKQPRPLLNMFAVLGIPFEHILNLYSATNAIGLAGTASRHADTLIKPEDPKEHKNRGLFSSILHRLGKK